MSILLCLLVASAVTVRGPASERVLAQPADSTKQRWYGTLKVEDVRHFRFVLETTIQDDTWSGTLTSLDEGGQQFAMEDFVRTDAKFGFAVRKTAAVYEGQFKDEGRSIAGKWKQGRGEFELNFRAVSEAPQRKIKTAWKGTLDAVIQKLDVALVELDSGEWFFESISQKAGGFVAKDESTDQAVIYRVPGLNGTFEGKLSDDASQVAGTWKQGPAKLDLVLSKVEAADLKAKQRSRPQTPQPPYPYESREITFASQAADVMLSGTLTIPRTDLAAGVVLISGSGRQDRDETLLGHKPFLVIADHFARHGIATLRYDDRGIGRSTGDFGQATSFDFADDAEGAWRHLRSLPEFKDMPLGLCGHSEGGLVAPIVAARNDQVAFIVLMAGPGVNGEEILYNQGRLILEAEGTAEAELQSYAKFQRALLSTVVKHRDASAEELEVLVTEALQGVLSKEELAADDIAVKVKAGVAQVSSPWFRTFLTLEPSTALSKVRCPVLAINGEKDLQVDPRLNLPAIRSALQSGGNDRFEIVEFPQMNHLFQTCRTGSVSEYEQIEETFSKQPLQTMTDWILKLPAAE